MLTYSIQKTVHSHNTEYHGVIYCLLAQVCISMVTLLLMNLLMHLLCCSEYPSLQWHWYDPRILTHLCSQFAACAVLHSSISAN